MRAVKAKQLRAIAKTRAIERNLPAVAYHNVGHKPRLVATGELNANGTSKMVKYTPITVCLTSSMRKHYKQLKKAA